MQQQTSLSKHLSRYRESLISAPSLGFIGLNLIYYYGIYRIIYSGMVGLDTTLNYHIYQTEGINWSLPAHLISPNADQVLNSILSMSHFGIRMVSISFLLTQLLLYKNKQRNLIICLIHLTFAGMIVLPYAGQYFQPEAERFLIVEETIGIF